MNLSVTSLQYRCRRWVAACLGEVSVDNVPERSFRFLEEALELCQSIGTTKEQAMTIVEYVYDRPIGEPWQEIGGTVITLASLCNALGLDMEDAAETELAHAWQRIEQIRQKAIAKRTNPALPGVV